MSVKKLVSDLLQGNVRALSRVISIIENRQSEAMECIKLIYPHIGRAKIVGVTGAAGSGKSTLVNELARALSKTEKKVGVIAVDPTSPFTGGAVLGDRIRMFKALERDGVFVRSMASRGALGGLAPQTAEVAIALDAAGFDTIIIETVGVGQSEVEIVRLADTVVLVVVPGMGDSVQALKAGILEIGDVFVINKADHSGVERLEKELISLLEIGTFPSWKPKIVKTIATTGEGISELLSTIDAHQKHIADSGQFNQKREQFLEEWFRAVLSQELLSEVLSSAEKNKLLPDIYSNLKQRQKDPRSLVRELIRKVLKN